MGYFRRIKRIVVGEVKQRSGRRRTTPADNVSDSDGFEELDAVTGQTQTSIDPVGQSSDADHAPEQATGYTWACNYLGIAPDCTREQLDARVTELRHRLGSITGNPQVEGMMRRLEQAHALVLERIDPTAARMRRIDV